MVAAPIFRQLLDMLVSLAKTFPGQFLPNAVRANSVAKSSDETAPDYATFWHMVYRSVGFHLGVTVGSGLVEMGKHEVVVQSEQQPRVVPGQCSWTDFARIGHE